MKMELPILTTLEKAAQVGLRKAGRETLKRSRELSPEESGGLKKQGRVTVDDLTVQISYDSLVALIQHENLDFVHDDGQAKFLEAAALEIDIGAIVAGEVRRAMSG